MRAGAPYKTCFLQTVLTNICELTLYRGEPHTLNAYHSDIATKFGWFVLRRVIAPNRPSVAMKLSAPDSAAASSPVVVSAKLVRGGEPVVGRNVFFTLGEDEAQALTDKNGVATAKLTTPSAAGTLEMTVAFPGDEDFSPMGPVSRSIQVRRGHG